jgi:hypothetical protein
MEKLHKFSRQGARIGILGTSLGSAILAKELAAHSPISICIFDSSENSIGGAWGGKPIKGQDLPLHNNVIVPYSERQQRYLPSLKYYLESHGATVFYDSFRGQGFHSSRPVLVGSFFPFVERVLIDSAVSTEIRKVSEVQIHHDSIMVDRQIFDYCFSSSNVAVKELVRHKFSGSSTIRYFPEFATNTSVHFRAIVSSNLQAGKMPKYSEEADTVFDRWGFIPVDSLESAFLFVGRVKRSKKHLEITDIQAGSEILRLQRPWLIEPELNFYTQNRIQEPSLERLLALSTGSRFQLLENLDLMTFIDDLIGLDKLQSNG